MTTPSSKRNPHLALAAALLMLAGCADPIAGAIAPTGNPAAANAPVDTTAAAPAADTMRLASTSPTVSVSDTYATYVASRAIDGNTDTEWQADGTNGAWIALDMQGPMAFTGVAIKAKPGQAFDLQVSDDGQTYRTVASTSTSTWSMETKAFPAGTTGRFVRVSYQPVAANVMVFELQPQATPIATPAPTTAPTAAPTVAPTATPAPAAAPSASATSSNGSNTAALAIDGNTDTSWQPASTDASPTLTIDRGSVMTLPSVGLKVWPGSAYTLSTSTDGSTWTTPTNQNNTTWNVETKTMPAGTTARYLRLQFGSPSKCAVFEAYPAGSAIATPAPTTAPTATPAPTSAPTATPTTAPTATPTPAPTATPAPATGAVATLFGNQSVPRSSDGTLTRGYQLLTELGMGTIREGWNWKNIETGDRQYVSWMNYFDSKAATLASMGIKEQVMICDTPTWASSNGTQYGVPNGLSQPIFADGTDVYKPGVGVNYNNTFAGYIFDLATRYKGEFGYYQVWNEPDFPSGDLGAGTTGSNGGTRYWDGSVQDYVRLLKVAATIVRGVDPGAKITLGGLGYEAYLGAIIDNGGAPYFDVVDFHAYGTDKTTSNGVLNSSWGLLGRYNALKGVMTSKGVTGKTYSVSETGFTSDNQAEQANYVAKAFATGLGLGDMALVQWAVFTNPGFNNIGVIDSATLSVKTQGYSAYTIATQQLAGCTPLGAVTGTNLQGYRFRRPDGKSLVVVWSTGTSGTYTLPFTPTQVLNVQGQAQSLPSGSLSVGISPVYIIG